MEFAEDLTKGLPAHAGMNRAPANPPSNRPRITRARGDKPHPDVALLIWRVEYPRTRG